MRSEASFATLCATGLAGAAMVFMILVAPSALNAAEPAMPVTRFEQSPPRALPHHDTRTTLDDNDEVAMLDAIHTALSQVGDGATYVWHRNHGRLSGAFQPTQSFKDRTGRICRHLVIMLVAGRHTQKTEGAACRGTDGRWSLEG